MKFRITYLFLTLSLGLSAQINTDSLWLVWNNNKLHDTIREKAIATLITKEYMMSNPDTAYIVAQTLLNFSKANNNPTTVANALHYQGYSLWVRGELNLALKKYELSLQLRTLLKLDKDIAQSLNNMSGIYYEQGNFDMAIDCLNKSLKIYNNTKYERGIASTTSNIGLLYQEQGEFEKSLPYLIEARKILEQINDKKGIAITNENIGLVYLNTGKFDEAQESFKLSLALEQEMGNKDGIANSLFNLGNASIAKKNYDNALSYFNQSIAIAEEIDDKMMQSMILVTIGKLYLTQEEHNKALQPYSAALKLAEEIGAVEEIKNAALGLYDVNLALGDCFGALKMKDLAILMTDSIKSEKNQNELLKQEYRYEYEKQKAIDEVEYEKQLSIQKEAKAKQETISYAIGLGLILVALFLLFIFNRLQVTKKQKNVIEEQKHTLESTHHELEEKNREILDSINYAKRIQSAILPPNKLVKEYLQDSFIIYKPKDIVAGDFYWLDNKNGKILFAAADCTGHGVPGAMVSVVCNNGLNRSVREHGLTEPGEILTKTREIIIEEFEKSEEEVKDGMDIALCSLEGNTLKYAGANNPLWIIRKNAKEVEEIKANKQPIGKYVDAIPFTTHTIELQKGDSFYIFSDGFVDQFGGEKGKKFKASNFKELLLNIQHETIEKQKELIIKTFEEWKGNLEQLDDVCIIGVKF